MVLNFTLEAYEVVNDDTRGLVYFWFDGPYAQIKACETRTLERGHTFKFFRVEYRKTVHGFGMTSVVSNTILTI